MLSVYYAECRLCFNNKKPFMLSVCMLNVIMLSVCMLNVIMLSVVEPLGDKNIHRHIPICHHTDQGAKVKTATDVAACMFCCQNFEP